MPTTGPFFMFRQGGATLRQRSGLFVPLMVLAVLLCFVQGYLFRDFWFDEALTVLNFALSEPVSNIYFNYPIPNNHIVYTMMLRLWIELQPSSIDPVVWMRFLSVIFAGATLVLLYRLFRSQFGGALMLPVLTATAASVPFLVYATAVRGYMLSALLVTVALRFALDYARSGSGKTLAGYAITCFLTTGAIPSNLAALGGVVLYALPLCGNNFLRRRRFWILALTPVAMFLLFYLPLARQFLGVLQLGEGWDNGFAVLRAVLAAFLYSYAMLLIPATGSILAFDRNRYNWLWSARAMIWLLPVPAALLLPTAPFPRIFLPFFPLWALLLAGGIRDLSALNCRWRRRWQPAIWIGALTLATLGWGWTAQWPELRQAFSRRCGGAPSDDFFYGYYLRPNHVPSQTIAALQKRFPDGAPPVYMSFSADPWPLMFYGQLSGFAPANYLFDGPRGPVPALPRGTLVIQRRGESAEELEKRFHCTLKPVLENENHEVRQVE